MKRLWQTSLASVRANILPGVVLWIVGLVVVFAYYRHDGSRVWFEKVMALKEQYGYWYSAVATAVFGGLIPFLYLWRTKRVPKGSVLSWALFFVIYWTIRGIEVDAFYRLQSWIFGDSLKWHIVAAKVAVDQFIYCIIWSAPLTAICYGWKDAGFSWQTWRKKTSRKSFLFEIASVLLSIWIVWIPATAIIYSLPLALQIPLFNLVLCFFVLLVSMLSAREQD